MHNFRKFLSGVLIIFSSCEHFGQGVNDRSEIFEYAKSKTVICVAFFRMPDGLDTAFTSTGLLLNNDYVMLTYHGLKPNAIWELKRALIYYGAALDTVDIDLNYESSAEQYDFRKHRFNRYDLSTDILIKKLNKKVLTTPTPLSVVEAKENDSVVVAGPSSKQVMPTMLRVMLINSNQGPKKYKQIHCLGAFGPGYSGSAIFNMKGEILGIVKKGFGNLVEVQAYLKPLLQRGIISSDSHQQIIEAYQQGLRLGIAIDLEQVINVYLKGYDN